LAALAATLLAASGVAQAAPILDTGAGSTSAARSMTITDSRSIAGFFDLTKGITVNGIYGWIGGDEGARLTANIYSEVDFVPAKLLYSTA
ncbi:hypothetical protein, partial [Sphingomonas sp. TDK1]|uniref:hypothetical protein n=1 Tax=Sphingomonas sp. TDK1 TaxID=453247 RepID=UPI0018DDA7F8